MWEKRDPKRLTRGEISVLVRYWIGVNDGYLGTFTYARHDEFWLDVCDLEVDTNAFDGTTRACFEATLFHVEPADQAAVLKAILDAYPGPLAEPQVAQPEFRSPELHRRIVGWIGRLVGGESTVDLKVEPAGDSVRRALSDAQTLLRSSGPQSAVDRVHTALHGYLRELAVDSGIVIEAERPTMNQYLKSLRAQHPALSSLGTRSEEITKVLGATATILDALNPLRNNATLAHPNAELLGPDEANLAINIVHTLFNYLESKVRSDSR